MTEEEEMSELLWDDLEAAIDRLYVASLKFARAFEQHAIDHDHDGPHPGPLADRLRAAMERYTSAYTLVDKAGLFDEIEDDE